MIIDVKALEATREFYIELLKNDIEYNQKAKQVERDYVQGVIDLPSAIATLKNK